MKRILELTGLPEELGHTEGIKKFIGKYHGIAANEILGLVFQKKSIDARKKPVKINLTVEVFINENPAKEIIEFDFKKCNKCARSSLILFTLLRLSSPTFDRLWYSLYQNK